MGSLGQYQNRTAVNERGEATFTIPAGSRESNSVNCEDRSLIAANILQNIESEFLEILGSSDNELFFPITSRYKEVLDLPTLDTPWDVRNAYFPSSYDVSPQETSPKGMFIKSDGAVLYITGTGDGKIHAYDIPSPWDISTSNYKNSYDLGGQDARPESIYFKDDGSAFFMLGTANNKIYKYNLTTAWDISSAVFNDSFSISAQETLGGGLHFKHDGTKMYITGESSAAINEYSLTKAWDLDTASYSHNLDISASLAIPQGIVFKNDGTECYVSDIDASKVWQITLTTPWDISTGSLGDNISTFPLISQPTDVYIRGNGGTLFIVARGTAAILKYNLPTEWDITSYKITQFLDTTNQDTTPETIFVRPDGRGAFIAADGDIFVYDLSTSWQLESATYVTSQSFIAQEAFIQGISFKSDGSKLFITGINSDKIHSYELSTPWDVTTKTLITSLDVSSVDVSPTGLYIKPDGTKIYLAGNAENAIHTYSLSIGWDLSTATYESSYDVSDRDSRVHGVFLKPDGTRMFVLGEENNVIISYGLATSWDINSTYYINTLDISSQLSPYGLFIKEDGKLLFTSNSGGSVLGYKLNRSSWISIDEPAITEPYKYLKLRASGIESGERTIKAIIKQAG